MMRNNSFSCDRENDFWSRKSISITMCHLALIFSCVSVYGYLVYRCLLFIIVECMAWSVLVKPEVSNVGRKKKQTKKSTFNASKC